MLIENTVVTVNKKIYKVDLHKNISWRESNKKTRAHVWGPGDNRNPSVEFQALADHIGAPSVYTITGEFPALDKAFKKMNKEIVAAKREVLDVALAAICDYPDELKINFSRKAGCSCGCSPGFILSEFRRGYTLYVSEKKD